MKYILWASGLIFILMVGYIVWNSIAYQKKASAPPPAPEVQIPSTYSSSTLDFSISYPKEFILDENYEYPFSENKTIRGVRFTIPGEMATGTNLASDSYIAIEQLPRAKNCTGDIYLTANVRAQTISENGVRYSFAMNSGAAAGNLYEELIYAISGSSPCTAVRYYIHSGNIQNYEMGTITEFDRALLISEFDKIRRSLSFLTSNTINSATSTP